MRIQKTARFVLLVLFAGTASAQSPATRARRPATTVVQPAPNRPATAPVSTPVERRIDPSEVIRVDEPAHQLHPRRDFEAVDHQGALRLPVPPHIAAVWQPLNRQLEVFAIDTRGTLKDVWKAPDGYWQPAFSLSAPGLAPAGAPVAAVWQPLNEQLEVFTISMTGALTVTWKAHNGRWFPPSNISPPNFAPRGANLAAVFQPLNNQIEVFAIDATGAVRLAWKSQNGGWQGPVTLTPPGVAPPGAPLTAVWQPLNEQLEVFWIDTTGALRGVWKQHNAAWAPPFTLTAAGFSGPRAHVAAVWQPLNEQLEVFTTDRAGAIKGVWKQHNGRWNAPFVLDGPGVAMSNAQITAMWDQQDERLQVATVGRQGELIKAFKTRNGAWKPGPGAFSLELAPPGIGGSWPTGAALAGAVQDLPPYARRTYFTIDDDQAVHEVVDDGVHVHWPWPQITRANFGPIYGAHAAACSNVLRMWSNGQDGMDSSVKACTDFMGITAHCERQGAYVSVGYPPQRQSPRYLQCTSKTVSENVVEQAEHIARGVAEGVADAAIATVVYSPEIIQGYACLDGVVFACASLAVDLASRANLVPPEVRDAVDLAIYASNCVDGDVVSCAKLGASGARAVGINIPGEDAGQVALLTQQCAHEDYGACLRLGERAAMAAGVPVNQINQAAKDAQDCYDGGVDACIALGRQAAKVGIPVGGIADGADNLRQCSVGSLADCQQLGQAVASVPR